MSAGTEGRRPDLDAYLRRVAYRGELAPTAAVLDGLHLAHATHIPFENIDVVCGMPVRLDLAAVEAKLVHARRGGYCFEHNRLFAEVLREIGFEVHELAARVRYRNPLPTPRTHMLLRVHAEDRAWLADVGFGGHGLLHPLPLAAADPVQQYHWRYRIAPRGAAHVLQLLEHGDWLDLYEFTDEAQLPVDYEMANHYASTHPNSRFVHALTVQLPAPDVRRVLRGRELIEDRGGSLQRRTLADASEVHRVLVEQFGLEPPGELPPG